MFCEEFGWLRILQESVNDVPWGSLGIRPGSVIFRAEI